MIKSLNICTFSIISIGTYLVEYFTQNSGVLKCCQAQNSVFHKSFLWLATKIARFGSFFTWWFISSLSFTWSISCHVTYILKHPWYGSDQIEPNVFVCICTQASDFDVCHQLHMFQNRKDHKYASKINCVATDRHRLPTRYPQLHTF